MHYRLVSALVLGMIAGRSSRAQGDSGSVQLASRGPAFFTVASPGTVRVDVRDAALFRQFVALDLVDVTVPGALRAIEVAASVHIAYPADLIPSDARVTIQAKRLSLSGVLTAVLQDVPADVQLTGDRVLALVRRGSAVVVPVGRRHQAHGAIVGTVRNNSSGAPMVGATVELVMLEVTNAERTERRVDTAGRYRFDGLRVGSYRLSTRLLGYGAQVKTVDMRADSTVRADFVLEKSVSQLDQVVVTGTVVPTEVKALPTPITVITGDEIAQRNIQHVDELFRGDVPGVLAWNQGTAGYYSSFATIRGTSSLTNSNELKVYVDGIEMANEFFLTDVDPASIARVEVIRGPQASTLYGSQALNGVIQIFTKKGEAGLTRPRIDAKISAGLVQSAYVNGFPVTQDYALQVQGGSERASYNLGGSYRSAGSYAPEFSDHSKSVFGGAHLTTGQLAVDLSTRYVERPFDFAVNPLYPAAYHQQHHYSDHTQQEMVAATATYQATPWWTHSLTAGVDRDADEQYRQRQLTTPADTFRLLSSGEETRLSVGYHTTVTARPSNAVSTTWTVGLEHWEYNLNQFYVSATPAITGTLTIPPAAFVQLSRIPESNDGYYAEAQAGLLDALFLTAGMRAEKSSTVGSNVGTVWAPRVGLSGVHQWGTVSAKVRASYGKGIRPPGSYAATANVQPGFVQLANPDLRPEQQTGVDAGAELYFGSRASLQGTYYDQRATDLITQVRLGFDVPTATGTYQYVNLSRVKNSGWEFQGSAVLVPALTLRGTYAITTSTVEDPGAGYVGDYRAGDRVLGVPKSTAGARLTYALPRTTLSAGMTYGGPWVQTSVRRLFTDYFVNHIFTNPTRSYWTTYPGFARFATSISQRLTSQLQGYVQVENIANRQTGEVIDVNIESGRTTTVGLRITY